MSASVGPPNADAAGERPSCLLALLGLLPRPPRRPPSPAEVAALDSGESWDRARSPDPGAVPRWRAIDRPQLEVARRAGAGVVVELGCGTGRLLAQLPGSRRIGLDIAPRSLATARARLPGVVLLRADVHALPFGDAAIAALLAGDQVFSHLDYDRAFAECARVLEPGGRLALHVNAAFTLTWRGRLDPWPPDPLNLFAEDEILEPAARAGLVCERVERRRNLPVPPWSVRIPGWLPCWAWSHATFVFRRERSPGA